MNRLCVIFHVQHRSGSGGHDKQQNILELGKKKDFSILIDSQFYEPISIIKSQSVQSIPKFSDLKFCQFY